MDDTANEKAPHGAGARVACCSPEMGVPSFWHLVWAEQEMQRDDDYLRALLQQIETGPEWVVISGIDLEPDEAEAKEYYHLLLLHDAGYLAEIQRDVFRITNAGYDFLAVTRESAAWEAAKGATRHLGGASIQMLYRVAEGFARQKLADLGIPMG